MKRAIKSSIMLTALFIVQQAHSQLGHERFKPMPATAVQDDLQTLRDSLIALHPGMYRYVSPASINQIFDSIINAETKPANILECYATIRYMLSAIKDGHTKASLPDSSRSYLKTEKKMFPAMLQFIKDKAYLPCEITGLPALVYF